MRKGQAAQQAAAEQAATAATAARAATNIQSLFRGKQGRKVAARAAEDKLFIERFLGLAEKVYHQDPESSKDDGAKEKTQEQSKDAGEVVDADFEDVDEKDKE